MARVIDLQDEIAARAREAEGAGAVAGADQLRRLSAEVVRPLSHELMLEPTSITIAAAPFVSDPPRWAIRDVLREACRAPSAGHWGVCAVMGLLGLVGLSLYGSAPLLLLNLGWDIVLFGLVPAAMARVALPARARLSVGWAWVLNFVQWSLLGTVAVVGTAGLMQVTTGEMTHFWGVSILYVALSAVIVIALAGFRRQWQLEDELSAFLVQQETLASRLMLRIDRERRELGLVLHGSVQASLTRGAMALERWGRTPDADALPAAVAEVQAALDTVVRAFDSGEPFASGLDVVVRDRLRLWEGAVQCTWYVSPEAVQAIDGALAKGIGDIIGEAVTNAVRHGQADEVNVDVRLDGPSAVVSVRDNGTGPVAVRHPGAGLALLARAGLPWTLDRVGSWTEFTARVPALLATS